MINPQLRKEIVGLINEAIDNGSRRTPACEEAGISTRTYQRWQKDFAHSEKSIDKRTICVRPEPHNKLTNKEEKEILRIVNTPEFAIYHLAKSYLS